MSGLYKILRDSLTLLKEKPIIFLPKLFSALVGSLWFIGLVSGRISLLNLLLLFGPISIIGVLASLMVASMVKQGDISLKTSFYIALSKWRQSLLLIIAFSMIGFLISLPLSIGIYWYLITGSSIILTSAAIITISLMFAFVFASYFIPITILEEKNFRSSIKESLNVSKSRPKEVTLLTLFSFLLLGLTTASNEYLEALGYIGFLLGRLTSSIATTYIFVVSPKYYLEV